MAINPNPDLSKLMRDAQGNLVLNPGGTGQLLDVKRKGVLPSTPQEAAVGGASTDAAKMAGTPAQTSAPTALPRYTGADGKGPQAGAKLEDVLKYGQRDAQMTAQQAERERESNRLQATFGNLGSRIQNLVDGGAFFGGGAEAPATPGLQGDTSQLTPEQVASLEEVMKSGGSIESIAAATEALGGADVSQYVNLDDLGQAAADQITQVMPDQIQLTPDVIQELGYAPEELAEALGVSPDQLDGISLAELQETIETQVRRDFQDVDQQVAVLSDPAAGPNERAAARAALKEMGATGVFATDVEMAQLEEEIAGADTVEFRGEPIKLDELLDDDFLSGVIKEYVDSDPDSDIRARLREEEPALAEWIDSHEGQLRELSIQLEGSLAEYGDIRKSNQAIVDDLSKLHQFEPGMIDEVMKQLDPDWGPYSTTKFNAEEHPGMQLLMDPAKMGEFLAQYGEGGGTPDIFAAGIRDLADLNPELAARVLSMSPEEMAELGLGQRDSSKWKRYMKVAGEWESLRRIDPKNPDSIAAYIFGPGGTFDDLQAQWRDILANEKVNPGNTNYEKWATIFDRDGDRRMDSPEQIQEALQARIPEDPTKDPFSTQTTKQLQSIGALRRQANRSTSPFKQTIFEIGGDGRITGNELSQVDFSKAGQSDLLSLLSSPALDREARHEVATVFHSREIKQPIADIYNEVGLRPDAIASMGDGDISGYFSNNEERLGGVRSVMEAGRLLSGYIKSYTAKHGDSIPAEIRAELSDRLRSVHRALERILRTYPSRSHQLKKGFERDTVEMGRAMLERLAAGGLF